MQVRFLLGPAGSGKTYRCLSEARKALTAEPDGVPMILLAPKQGTYQLEQQLLSTPELAGYSRLSILSFESLSRFVLEQLGKPCPRALSEEGRLMVLRGLLARHRDNLKLFRASARLTGFAQQLSQVLGEVQRAGLDPAALDRIAGVVADEGLRAKLQDFAVLLGRYLAWLKEHSLQDQEVVLKAAAACLATAAPGSLRLAALWVDGFAELSTLELDLLAALLPSCDQATVTFCLSQAPSRKSSWLSHWSPIERALENCRKRFSGLAGVNSRVEVLSRGGKTRFARDTILRRLEQCWEQSNSFRQPAASVQLSLDLSARADRADGAKPGEKHSGNGPLRLVRCVDREVEVIVAAREIVGFVRSGARYRDVAVLVRNLEPYYQIIQRVFARYQIPFFLDRRESVSHHPLAELTRSALRLVAFGWQQEDWFAVLKSGLVPIGQEEIDLLENEALARGWKGQTWLQPLKIRDRGKNAQTQQRLDQLAARLEETRRQTVPFFESFGNRLGAIGNRPSGVELATALRELWAALGVELRLEDWAQADQSGGSLRPNASVHETVWKQMDAWLTSAELAFPKEALSLREWLPILEAGLAALSVGTIPPALDQVLVGAVDRSRTPDVKLAVVLGLNEGVFPSKPEPGRLLSESDHLQLERQDVTLGPGERAQLARERYLGYIAFTRAQERLVVTFATRDATGAPLNPSSMVSRITELFPELPVEAATTGLDWRDSQHASELVPILFRAGAAPKRELPRVVHSLPWIGELKRTLADLAPAPEGERLSREVAARLYGPVLRTSVSRMEQFAACPFRFFVHSGLRAEERKRFELDIKEQGTFQHDALALFHQLLRSEGKRWRDITPEEARARIGKIAIGLLTDFREGLLQTSDEARFTARMMMESLQDFVEIAVGWMREQYQFEPAAVELPFGTEEGAPAWQIDLGKGKRLEIEGRIDRVDLYRQPGMDAALCVVLDYKSSHKQLDPVLMLHGLQLQLLTYLNVIRQWPGAGATFGVQRLKPAGVFYVNLRGRYGRETNRAAALKSPERARRMAYRHSGRFELEALRQLDSSGAQEGDQFNYRLTKASQIKKNCKEALLPAAFKALLDRSEETLREMGQRVYAGNVEVSPYRRGMVTACDQCTYHAICRIDPWTHRFRALIREDAELSEAATDVGADFMP